MSEQDVTLGEFTDSEEGTSDDWRPVTLGEVSSKRSDNVDPQEISLSRHVGLEHIHPNTPTPDWEPVDGLSSTKRRFKPGDILFAKLRPNLEKAAQPDFEGIASTDIFPIVAKEGINSKYLLYRLSSNPAYDHARRTSVGTRMPRTSWNLFSNFEFDLPPLEEQRKIASVLYTVDQAIQKTEEIIEQTERVRRGVEQDVLTRGVREDGTLRPADEIRFRSSWVGEIPDDWIVQQYSELISDSSVGIVVKPSQYYDDEGTVPILRSKDISRDGIVDGDFEYMSEESNAENKNSQLQEGDVITVRSGDPGLSCVVDAEYDGANCADLLISTPGAELDPHYASMWINSFAGRKQIDRFQAGLAQKHFNLGALRKLRVGVPPLDEQKRIVEKVSSISGTINRNKKYNHRLHRLKRGLMQDLLSGEVRTHDKDIEILDDVLQHG